MSAHANRPSQALSSRTFLFVGRIRRVLKAVAGVIGAGLVKGEAWIERSGERRALRGMDDHMLKDIGISRSDAEREGNKPFWKR